MALEIKGMTRSFTFKKGNGMVTLDDPNTSDSPEMVMNYYSNFYPELTTATVHGPVIKEDKAVYEFKTTIGTNGLEGSSSDRPYAISVTVRTGKKGLRHRGVPFLFSERHVSAKTFTESCRGRFRREKA